MFLVFFCAYVISTELEDNLYPAGKFYIDNDLYYQDQVFLLLSKKHYIKFCNLPFLHMYMYHMVL